MVVYKVSYVQIPTRITLQFCCIASTIATHYVFCTLKAHEPESFFKSYQLLSKSQNFPTFYVTQRFITMFTTAYHFPRFKPDESNPNCPILSLYMFW